MRLSIILSSLLLTACPGPRGDQGESGSTVVGSSGSNGTNGLNAQPCSVINATNGALIVCPDGTQQFVSNGVDGQSIVGPQGPVGLSGSNGIDATPITLVQFCPGTTVYPSTFVEIGLCISNNIYAVYSANNGFLTYIPPGNYSSNAIGSSCSFTVLPNCQISP